jgi:copper(I)-binding protein
MNRILPGALALLLLVSPIVAHAHEVFILGTLEISGGFSRATLPNAPVGVGYLTITNKGTADDTLTGVVSPVASTTQIHEMRMEGDVMKMNEVEGGLDIPAGQSVTLAPGGLHIMFMQLKEPLIEGSKVPVTLTFATSGTIEIELVVGSINAAEPEHHMSGM